MGPRGGRRKRAVEHKGRTTRSFPKVEPIRKPGYRWLPPRIESTFTPEGDGIRATLEPAADESMFTAAQQVGIPAGRYVDHEALDVLRQVAKILDVRLEDRLSHLNHDDLIEKLASNLEVHDRSSAYLQDEAKAIWTEEGARSIRHLIERTLLNKGGGTEPVSLEEAVRLSLENDRLERLRTSTFVADPAAARLNRDHDVVPIERALVRIELTLSEDGALRVVQRPRRLDIDKFIAAQTMSGPVRHDQAVSSQLVPRADGTCLALSREFRTLNETMASELGFSLRDWFSALVTLRAHSLESPVSLGEVQTLIDRHAVRAIPRSRRNAVLDWIVLGRHNIRGSPPDAAVDSTRTKRVALRPVFQLPRSLKLLWHPYTVGVAADLALSYLAQRTVPWPREDLPWLVRDAVRAAGRPASAAFEREVADAARSFGCWVIENLRPEDARALGLPLTGEVDVLAADPSRCLVWVLEAKDAAEKYTVEQISVSLDQFLTAPCKPSGAPNNYAAKLIRKTEEIRQDVTGFVAALGGPQMEWKSVRCAFVSRTPLPASCAVPSSGLEFILLSSLRTAMLA